jgi:hypothetical protein
MWATLGVVLAVALRQSAVALGLGLVYASAELIFAGIVRERGGMARGLPGFNATALADSFAPAHLLNPPPQVVGPGAAALVLALYVCIFVVTAGILVSYRDVS